MGRNVPEDVGMYKRRVNEAPHSLVLFREKRPMETRAIVVHSVVPIVEEYKVEHGSSEIATVIVLAVRVATVMLQHVQCDDEDLPDECGCDVNP